MRNCFSRRKRENQRGETVFSKIIQKEILENIAHIGREGKKISINKLFTNLVLIPEKRFKKGKLEDSKNIWSKLKLQTSHNTVSLNDLFVPQQSHSKKKKKKRYKKSKESFSVRRSSCWKEHTLS